ncbi:MAG: hypothetical protein M3R54_08485 [Chloroflexota bacterium]|nr:hypothetical protein [Chloroflexota bacterium]
MTSEDPEGGRLRRSIILAASLAIVGLVAELLVERHWGSVPRYIPWLALVGLAWSVLRLWRVRERAMCAS